MVLPFDPLNLVFSHIYYSVDMPAVRLHVCAGQHGCIARIKAADCEPCCAAQQGLCTDSMNVFCARMQQGGEALPDMMHPPSPKHDCLCLQDRTHVCLLSMALHLI